MKKNLLSIAFIAGISAFALGQNSFNLPFVETFEEGSTSRQSWTNLQIIGAQNWTFQPGSSGGTLLTAHGGALNARFYSGSGTNTPVTKLISPVINAGTNTTAFLEFYYAQPAWANDTNALKVYYRLNETSDWVELFSNTNPVETWTKHQIQLPQVSSTMQFAFEGINNWGRANVIDDVKVKSGLIPLVAQMPFHETFEQNSETRAAWTNLQVTGTQNWTFQTGSNPTSPLTTANNGTLNARFYSGSGVNSPITKLITPIINAGSVRKGYLEFSYAQPDWEGDNNSLKVYYRVNDTSDWVQLFENDSPVNTWKQKRISVPEFSSELQFAFEGINNWGYANVIDDVKLVEGEIPALPEVCGVNNVSNEMENGYGNTILYAYANDFRVNPIAKIDVSQISFNLITSTSGIATASYSIVNDDNGKPGEEVLYTFTGAPTTTESLGTNFGFNFSKYTYNLPEELTLENTTNTHKTFWLIVEGVQPLSGTNAYWETTSNDTSEHPMMVFDTLSQSWSGMPSEGVFTIVGECSIIDRSLPCEFETPSNGIENGHGNLVAGQIAHDFVINPGSDFHLEAVDINLMTTSGFTSTTLNLYQDGENGPGELISTYNLTPTNRVTNGSNYGYDGSTYTFVLPETVTLESGKYWLGLTNSIYASGTNGYWESTTLLNSSSTGRFKSSPTATWTEFTSGEWDGVFKLIGGCQRLTINDQVIEISKLTYYPNPVTDILFIKHKLAVSRIDVFNLAGQNVLTTKTQANGSVNLVKLPKGVYIVNATLADGTNQTFKVIKK